MGSSNSTPPAPPAMSTQEQSLLAKQNMTMDEFRQILGTATEDSATMQQLYKEVSGLYQKKTIPGVDTPPQYAVDPAAIDAKIKEAARTGSVQLQNGRTATLGELERAKTDLPVAISLGLAQLTNPGGRSADKDTYVLDPEAVAKVKERVLKEQQAQQQITDLQIDRYKRALEGTLPVSTGLLQRKEEDFKLLREGAARRGIMIDGDSPDTAVSQTTAGNELVGQFKRTYGLLEDTERRGELATALPSYGSSYAAPLNFSTSSTAAGPAGLLPTYSGLTSMYGGATAPYQSQRDQQYQYQIANYNAQQQKRAGVTGLLGTAGGMALMGGHPLIGGGLLAGGIAASYL